MLVDQNGSKIPSKNAVLFTGNVSNGWSYSTINLNDNISNYRALIFEYTRSDSKKGFIQVPVLSGRLEWANSLEVVSNKMQYIELRIQNVQAKSLQTLLLSWIDAGNNGPLVINGVYGLQ